MPRIGFGLLVFLLGLSTSQAQIDNHASLYSRYGIGERLYFPSSQSHALGGAATALFTVNGLSVDNPATWSAQTFTRFTAGFQFEGVESEDAAQNVSRLNNGLLNALHLGIPLQRGRLGLTFAYQPYSRVGYQAQRTGQLEEALGEPASSYTIFYEGNGGLQELQGGLGYRVGRHVSLGAALNFRFGIIEYGQRTEMQAATTFIPETEINEALRMRGVTATLGGLLVLPRTPDRDLRLTSGLAITLPTLMYGDRTRILNQVAEPDTLGASTSGDLTLPLTGRVGFTISPSEKWLFALDSRYEAWKQFKSDFPLYGYSPDGGAQLRDSWRIGGGVQFTPAGTEYTPRFLERITYRLGLYALQDPYRPVPEADIKTYALTGGVGIPSLFSGTYVDLNGEIGTRGTTDLGLVRDLFFRVSATINFGERWFVKRRLR